MTERCIVRVKFTPAGSSSEVRRAVGGFLRYLQHRDLHPDSQPARPTSEVSGLLKYVAYRDRANQRAELFGPEGPLGSHERKAFGEFVARSIADSRPQPYQTRDGQTLDRRRAVSRFVISPEHSQGLDLAALTRAAVRSLESEAGADGLRWIAAIHRNTRHHHVHLVLAGMVADGAGGYRRADVTKPRLAAMKQAVALDIERQRGDRSPSHTARKPMASGVGGRERSSTPALKLLVSPPALIRALPLAPLARLRVASAGGRPVGWQRSSAPSSLLALRAVARQYARQMQREAEEEALRRNWERAA
ncbi:MAG: relaxase MobL [Candidatus Dormibacteraeota bacterium]|nr:relaxase MobL [Candidatus Dormibacteraeota bacterium]